MLSLKNLIFALVVVACIVAATTTLASASSRFSRLEALRKKKFGKEFYPACLSVTQMGYPCENIPIQTADGFIIGAIRIPPKVNGSYPVILQHGLIDSSSTWTMNY